MSSFFFFFFNDTATTEIYTLSLHDALPICELLGPAQGQVLRRDDLTLLVAEREHETITLLWPGRPRLVGPGEGAVGEDRKSTRLNSSHGYISYAVFCLKKKKNNIPSLRYEC